MTGVSTLPRLVWESRANPMLVVPWGRFASLRQDLVAASKTKEEGGTGIGKRFWEWTEEQIKPYLE